MPRPLRKQEPGYLHHVVCRGNNKQDIFRSKRDYFTYLDYLLAAKRDNPIKIYNFCLMSNHIHLLIEPEEHGAMSKAMEYVTKGYAKYFNLKYDHVGHVFQGRFKSFLIQQEKYFLNCMRYIDLNPVKAGVATDAREYPWCGHRYLAFGEELHYSKRIIKSVDPEDNTETKKIVVPLATHELYEELGSNEKDRQSLYRAWVLGPGPGKKGEIDFLNRKAGILGDKQFREKL